MTEMQLKFLIEMLFLRHDKLWHFTVKEVGEFATEAVELAKKEGLLK
jgi:hypothetical protein